MTRLETAEMRFLRSATGYTRLDKVRSEDITKELEISGIQDLRLKYKQKLDQPPRKNGQHQTYKRRGRRDRERPRKRWQLVDAGTGQTT